MRSRYVASHIYAYVHEAYHIVREQCGDPPDLPNNVAIAGASHGLPTPEFGKSDAKPVSALGRFNQRLQQDNKPIEWVFDRTVTESTGARPRWVAKAMVDGECWGVGHGATRLTAKNEAAKKGLKRMGYDEVRLMPITGARYKH